MIMSRLRPSRTDGLLLCGLVASAAVVSWHVLPQPAHGVLAVLVLVVAPAAAIQRCVRIPDPLAAVVVATAFALALVVTLATLLLYLQVWSQAALLAAAVCVSVALTTASTRAST